MIKYYTHLVQSRNITKAIVVFVSTSMVSPFNFIDNTSVLQQASQSVSQQLALKNVFQKGIMPEIHVP